MTRRLVVVAIALVAGAAVAGPPERVIDLPETPAEIVLPTGWTELPLPEVANKPVAAYRSPAGVSVVITRAGLHNPEAWSERKRGAYVDQVEAGVSAAADGYQRKKRTILKVQGVPAADLELSRKVDGAREDVLMRFLFFRTYTLTLAATGSREQLRKDRTALEAVVRRFGPPKGYVP